MAITQDKLIVGGLVLIAGYVAYRGFGGVAKDVSKAIVNTADGVIGGTVIGVGNSFGIPDTSKTQCETDISHGGYWDASFSCPAKRYAQFLLTGK